MIVNITTIGKDLYRVEGQDKLAGSGFIIPHYLAYDVNDVLKEYIKDRNTVILNGVTMFKSSYTDNDVIPAHITAAPVISIPEIMPLTEKKEKGLSPVIIGIGIIVLLFYFFFKK